MWLRWTILISVVCCSIGILQSQSTYQKRKIDLSEEITYLSSTDQGHLIYGTASGEVGTFDGIALDRMEKLQGGIVSIQDMGDEGTYYLTTNGVYRKRDKGSMILESPSHLHVLSQSQDRSLLVTTAGIYIKSGSDYLPDRELFYDVNEVDKGALYEQKNQNYLRLDEIVYHYDKSWKEHILKGDNDYAILPWKDEGLLLADATSFVVFSHTGTVDTLLQVDTMTQVQLYGYDVNKAIVCDANNKVYIFDGRSRTLQKVGEVPPGPIRAAVIDGWANIWLASGRSLYSFIPNGKAKTTVRPTLRLTSIKINGENQGYEDKIHVDEASSDLEIQFKGVQLTYPQDLEYQTRLSKTQGRYNDSSTVPGLDEWSPLTKVTNVEYRDLPAGIYQFEVRATVDGTYYTFARPTLRISVSDKRVERYGLAGLLGALAVVLTAVFFNARYNRLKEKSANERTLLMQENKMLVLQQKALQLQMNPHFVFNALNSIQGLIAKEDNKRARRYLQQFSSMMRTVLMQSRQETITLEEEISYLESYLSLEQMANNDKFDYEIETDEMLDLSLHIPTMIIQPFIENSIIHGIKNLQGRRGRIVVSISDLMGSVVCTVEDNGVGRQVSMQDRKSDHKSVAISVARERLISLGVPDPIRYTDLLDAQGAVIGTSVELHLSR